MPWGAFRCIACFRDVGQTFTAAADCFLKKRKRMGEMLRHRAKKI